LNPFGLELIGNIRQGKDFDQLKKEMTEKYDVDVLTFEKDFYEFCALLKHHQIIIQDDPMDFK
jgi:hypothetical protein